MSPLTTCINKIPLGYRITISILIVLLCPFLLTRPWSSTYYFDASTGYIGDTIGGLTAPAIGLLNAWLLFITLKRQDYQIKNQESQFKTQIQRQEDQFNIQIQKQDEQFAAQVRKQEEDRLYTELYRSLDSIKDTISNLELTIYEKHSTGRVISSSSKGVKTFFEVSKLFDISSKVDSESLNLSEWRVFLHGISEITLKIILILEQNHYSTRTQREKEIVTDSVDSLLVPIEQFYEKVSKFKKSYPEHKINKELELVTKMEKIMIDAKNANT